MLERKYLKSKGLIYTLAFIFIFSVYLFLSIDRHKFREGIYNGIDSFESLNLGISGIPGLYGRSHIIDMSDSWAGIFYTLLSEFPEKVIFRTPEFIKNFLLVEDKNIGTLELNVNYKNWGKILANRSIALRKTKLLIQRDQVKVTGKYNNKKIKGELRLKGDFSNHWRSNRRMSLNVTLSNESASVKSYKRFNLHKPAARQFPYEPLFQKIMSKIGIASVQHEFINVVVNGVDWGVMNIQETYSKEFLEKLKLKDSLIIKLGDESEHWKITSTYGQSTQFQGGSPNITSSVYKPRKNFESRIKRDQYSYIMDKIITGNLKGIVNIEKFTNMALFSLIWGDQHVTMTSNSRYYLNPYTLQLEPISSDQSIFKILTDERLSNILFPQIYKFALEETIKAKKLLTSINSLSIELNNAEKYGAEITSHFPNDYPIDYSILHNNFQKLLNHKEMQVGNVYEYTLREFGDSRTNLSNEQWNLADNFVTVKHYENGEVHIYNNLPIPVKLTKLIFKDKNYLDNPITLEGLSKNPEKPILLIINTNIKGAQDSSISVEAVLGRFTKKSKNNYTHTIGNFNPLEQRAHSYKEFSDFLIKNNKNYSIKPGRWIVSNPLVIDGNLSIGSETELLFSDSSYLIVKGSLIMDSDINYGIKLKALEGKWKGIYILGNSTSEPSKINNVSIQDASNLEDGILELTGALNIYDSDISINKLKIENILAEDAINIVNSRFKLSNSTITNTSSDAVDIDFSTGSILNINISHSNGDALDFSGSDVNLKNINISNSRDKALSIGENSKINGDDLNLVDIGVGVATKDGSIAKLKNIKIQRYTLAGAMAYIKKDFYNYPTLVIEDAMINSNLSDNKFLRQEGSYLYLNGRLVNDIPIDVDNLYKSTTMQKKSE